MQDIGRCGPDRAWHVFLVWKPLGKPVEPSPTDLVHPVAKCSASRTESADQAPDPSRSVSDPKSGWDRVGELQN